MASSSLEVAQNALAKNSVNITIIILYLFIPIQQD